MSLLNSEEKHILLPHFELYYELWYKSFNKTADPLILFYHWLLIHNRFKCVIDGEKTDYLPSKWNSAKNYYDILYTKHEINYRLEIYLIGNLLHVNFKRLSDQMDTLQHLKITDFIDDSNYNNPKYKLIYKDLDIYYKRLQWSINTVKQRKKKNLSSRSSESSSCKSGQSKNSGLSTPGLEYNEIVMQIKKEKLNMDNELESLRRSSLISSNSSTNLEQIKNNKDSGPVIAEKLNNKNNCKKLKRPANINRSDLYEYNPITNYYNYNTDVQRALTLDENNCLREPFYGESFKKYDLKFLSIELVDCFKGGMFENLKVPISLTSDMKKILNLKPTIIKKKSHDRKRKNSHNHNYKRKRKSSLNRHKQSSIGRFKFNNTIHSVDTTNIKVEKKNPLDCSNFNSQDSESDISLPELNMNNKNEENPLSLDIEKDMIDSASEEPNPNSNLFCVFENLKANKKIVTVVDSTGERSDKENNEEDLEDRAPKRSKQDQKDSPLRTPLSANQADVESESPGIFRNQSTNQSILTSTGFTLEKILKTPDTFKKPKETKNSVEKTSDKKKTPVTIRDVFAMQIAKANSNTPKASADIMKTPTKNLGIDLCTSPLTRSQKKKD